MRRGIVALAGAVALAACAGPVDLGQGVWQADLAGGPGGITGSVAAISDAGRTDVSIGIQQALAGRQYVWRLAHGDCRTEGAALGGTAVYPTLLPGDVGTAQAEAVLSQPLRTGPYAARVFLLQTDGGQALAACGSLQQTH